MGQRIGGSAVARRKLLRLGGLGALLGLARGADRAEAANGDPILLGRTTTATRPTTLTGDVDGQPALQVESSNLVSTALEAQGGNSADVQTAGWGIRAIGGRPEVGHFGGDGAQAFGGASLSRAVAGVRAVGGSATSGRAGHGVSTSGGESIGGFAGTGAQAFGGSVLATDGTPGVGIRAVGIGDGDLRSLNGLGLYAEGGGHPGAQATAIVGQTARGRNAGISGTNLAGWIGVQGMSETVDAAGNPQPGTGVGVRGQSGSGDGGFFESTSGNGVVGRAQSGTGLTGTSTSGTGVGGASVSGDGVAGTSDSGGGLEGTSTTGVGGWFLAQDAGQWAGQARNTPAANGIAGGQGLLVNGIVAVESGLKSAIVKTSQGDTLLYCVESPTSMFEDVGTARLSGGGARVTLDPVFAGAIDASYAFVFLTPHSSETAGLAVVAQDAAGFTVAEAGGGNGSYEFGYRVVARRKGLTTSHRLARLPVLTLPTLNAAAWLQPPVRPPLPEDRLPTGSGSTALMGGRP